MRDTYWYNALYCTGFFNYSPEYRIIPCSPDHFFNAEAQRRRDAEPQRGKQRNLCSSVFICGRSHYPNWYQVYQVDDPANGCPYLTIFLAVCYHGSVEALKRWSVEALERWSVGALEGTKMETTSGKPTVIRTERGLTIANTRITLYQIMDYVQAGMSPSLIRDHFKLTIKQKADVLHYIETHQEEIKTE
jgi:hypothetical protein